MKRKLLWIVILAILALLALWFAVLPSLSGLANTEWQLVAIREADGSTVPVEAAQGQFTLAFDRSAISGRANCNTYKGQYRLNPFTHRFSTNGVFATLMGCLEESGMPEADYFDAFSTATRYEIGSDELHIIFDDGMRVLVFRRVR